MQIGVDNCDLAIYWLFIFEEEEKLRSLQKLKTAAQATKEVYASVSFHYLRLSSDILCACHLILV